MCPELVELNYSSSRVVGINGAKIHTAFRRSFTYKGKLHCLVSFLVIVSGEFNVRVLKVALLRNDKVGLSLTLVGSLLPIELKIVGITYNI